jgi:hypothetical protein
MRQALRKIFWVVIVEGKHGLGEETLFDFKYVPDFHVTTEVGDDNQVGIKEHGIERRNLKVLLIGLTCAGVGIYTGIYVASSIFQRISNVWPMR